VPATDGTGRYPKTPHFSHYMEHYIQLLDADKLRNIIDLAYVPPLPVSSSGPIQTHTLATQAGNLDTRSPVLSPCSNQDLEPTLHGHGVSTQQGTAPFSSMTILPDFVVGGYKVKSHSSGIARDDDLYKSHKYISEMAKTIALSCPMFTENLTGRGQSYEEWRLIFANAVGSCHFVTDFVMGYWLRGWLAQDVANDVERVMGQDATGTSIYRHCSTKVLDAYLQQSVYAFQLSDHHYNQEMQRGQHPDENPQQYEAYQTHYQH
jgi:hypothetical protein